MKPFNKSIASALAVLALVGLNACDTSTPVADSTTTNKTGDTFTFADIKADKDFAFSIFNEEGLTVKLQITTTEGLSDYASATIKLIVDGQDAPIASAITNAAGEVFFDGTNIPSDIARLGVQVSAAGIPEETLWYTNAELTVIDRIVLINPTSFGTSAASAKIAAKSAAVSAVFPNPGATIDYVDHAIQDYNLVSGALFVERSNLNPIAAPNLVSVETRITAATDPAFKNELYAHFMHTGAGYQNSFGYYWYLKSANPTGALANVNMVTLFDLIDGFYGIQNSAPRALVGTVANFKSMLVDANDEVVIGYWLQADYEQGANPAAPIWYSNIDYNTQVHGATEATHYYSTPATGNARIVLGIEDLRRPGSDEDYNDAVFIVDMVDVNPNTPINCAYPTTTKNSRLGYEDQYPQYGDFDFNDVVVDVDYSVVSKQCDIFGIPIVDATYGAEYAPQLVSASIDATPVANGAEYALGFAIAFPTLPGAVVTVDNAVSAVSTVGTETIIDFFDFARGQFLPNPNTIFVNTVNGSNAAPEFAPKATLGADIAFAAGTPIPPAGYTITDIVNPFIYMQLENTYEIHMKGKALSARGIAQNLTGTPADGHAFQDANGIPWAVEISQSTLYPREFIDVTAAYPQFAAWAQTGTPANWSTTGVPTLLY